MQCLVSYIHWSHSANGGKFCFNLIPWKNWVDDETIWHLRTWLTNQPIPNFLCNMCLIQCLDCHSNATIWYNTMQDLTKYHMIQDPRFYKYEIWYRQWRSGSQDKLPPWRPLQPQNWGQRNILEMCTMESILDVVVQKFCAGCYDRRLRVLHMYSWKHPWRDCEWLLSTTLIYSFLEIRLCCKFHRCSRQGNISKTENLPIDVICRSGEQSLSWSLESCWETSSIDVPSPLPSLVTCS